MRILKERFKSSIEVLHDGDGEIYLGIRPSWDAPVHCNIDEKTCERLIRALQEALVQAREHNTSTSKEQE